jgi:ribosome maturation factor RimP
VRDRLIAILEPRVAELGYELVELEHSSGLVRIYIDKAAASGSADSRSATEAGITVDDCERASRQVSAVLDAEDPIPGHYTLEVSSPGIERPLRTTAHFAAAVGKKVKLELATPLAGTEPPRKRFTGTVVGVSKGAAGDEVALEVDGKTYGIPLCALGRARLVA